jgi:hypothetical protein
MTKYTMRLSLGVVLAIACLVLPMACSKTKTAPVVSGLVSFDNERVTFGQVVFYLNQYPILVAPIGPDGSYSVSGLPENVELQVAVLTMRHVEIVMPDQLNAEMAQQQDLPPIPGKDKTKTKGPTKDKPPAPGNNSPAGPPSRPDNHPKVDHGKEIFNPNMPGLPGNVHGPATQPKAFMSEATLPVTATPEMKEVLLKIQAKYGSPEKSGLTITVSGDKTFDLNLQP